MTPKKTNPAFTSFRIIGKKAQDLMQRASELKKSRGEEKVSDLPHEKEEALPEVRMQFAIGSVAKATVTILAIIIAAWAIYQLADKLLLLVLGLFVAAIIDPTVRMMEKWGFPRGVAILLHYFFLFFIILFLLVSLIPLIAQQLQNIALLLTQYVNNFMQNPMIQLPLVSPDVNARLTDLARSVLENLSIGQLSDAIQNLGRNMSTIAQSWVVFATKVAGSVVAFFVKAIIVLVLAFFIQLEKEKIFLWLAGFFPQRYRVYLDDKADAVHLKIGQWARGQATLGLAIGTLAFIALNILGMSEYAITLAVLAALTEFVPYIGPFIAAVPAVLIALSERGFVWALIVVGVYYVIQWCENNLLVPLIMKRAVGISPIAIMFAMLVGVSFPDLIHPILGLLLAVPATTIIGIFLDDWRRMRQKSK
jgi:predicted PurR-regulated permease PerM